MSIVQLMGSGDMVPAADANAASLVTALPLNLKYGFNDQSFRVRGTGAACEVVYASAAYQPAASISTALSKYYGSSFKKPETNPAGTTFHGSELQTNTGAAATIGTQNYCIEAWFYTSDFGFAGADSMSLCFPANSPGSLGPTAVDWDVPRITIKGDNWNNTSQYKRGLHLTWADYTFICESSQQVLSPGTWHHLAATRSGTTARLFVDGAQVGTGTDNRNYTGFRYIHFSLNRTVASQIHFNDLRVYVGAAKYTSNFTPPGQMFI